MEKIILFFNDTIIKNSFRKKFSPLSYDLYFLPETDETSVCDFIDYDIIIMSHSLPNSAFEICKMIKNLIDTPIILVINENYKEKISSCAVIIKRYNIPTNLIAKISLSTY